MMWGVVKHGLEVCAAVAGGELEAILEMRVKEESHSSWYSPLVLVPLTDGTLCFYVDYSGVNEVSQFDAYPMAQVDDLLDRPGFTRHWI